MRKSTLQIIDNRQYLFKQSLVAVVQQFFLLAPYPLAIVFQVGPLPQKTIPILTGLLFLGRQLFFKRRPGLGSGSLRNDLFPGTGFRLFDLYNFFWLRAVVTFCCFHTLVSFCCVY